MNMVKFHNKNALYHVTFVVSEEGEQILHSGYLNTGLVWYSYG